MLLLGSHVSLSGRDQFLGSVEEAILNGATALMVYTGAPQNTVRKDLKDMKIPEAKAKMAATGFPQEGVIVHAPYIVNLANPDPEKRDFAVEFLIGEVERTEAMGSTTLILHPGSHLGQGPDRGIELIREGINRIIEGTPGNKVRIAVEGMAGKGTEIGSRFTELAAIIDGIDDKSRIGICLDTCHSHDAGYAVKDDFPTVLQEIDSLIGIDKILSIHVNDSKNPRGAHKDRHINIGFGEIGFSAIYGIVHHKSLAMIPKILETPYVKSEKFPTRSYPPYRYEIAMLRSGKFDSDMLKKIISDHEGNEN